MRSHEGKACLVMGAQWGDEGKGKLVDKLAATGQFSIVARPAGGPNAGHSVVVDGNEYKFHGLPEGAIHPNTVNVIGPGAVVDPIKLLGEIERYGVTPNNLVISYNTHLITPVHVSKDEIAEALSGRQQQGSTKAGMRYVAADKSERSGVPLGCIDEMLEDMVAEITYELSAQASIRKRLELPNLDPSLEAEKWREAAFRLSHYADDTTLLLNEALAQGENILVSGAQSHWLDVDEQVYPYGSSTHTGVGGAISGLQIPAEAFHRNVIGVMKGIKSRVGNGPFVTEELDTEKADSLRGPREVSDSEYGTTSGRPRRVGNLDLPEIRRSILANGIAVMALTKLDHLRRFGDNMLIATHYNTPKGRVDVAPNTTSALKAAEPHYEELPLWNKHREAQVQTAKTYRELPPEARALIKFIEKQLDIKIQYIGNGQNRSQLIVR